MERTETAMRGIRILELLQWGKRHRAQELAEDLGVSTRTVHEYVAQLRRAGINIRSGPGFYGAFWISNGEEVHPMRFTTEEMQLIVNALRTLQMASDLDDDVGDQARTLAQRLTNVMPLSIREGAAEFEQGMGRRLQKMAYAYDYVYVIKGGRP